MEKGKAGSYTKRVYRFDESFWRTGMWLTKDMSFAEVLLFVKRVWDEQHIKKKFPTLFVDIRDDPQSRCYPSHGEIVFAHNQLTPLVACHEVAHYVTPNKGYDHGPAFVDRYVPLLLDYGRCPKYVIEQATECRLI